MSWLKNIVKAADKAYYDTVGAGDKAWNNMDGDNARAEEKKKKDMETQGRLDANADATEMNKFKSQDLLNADADLYVPQLRNGAAMKEQEAMLSLFNARKTQILSARRTPSVNQTRF